MIICIIGLGKMGKTIEKMAVQQGHNVGLKVKNFESLTNQLDLLRKCDVAIEFTKPEAAFQNLITCFENNVPVVSGTTGWLEKYEEAKLICESLNGSFLYASNFSVGVNIFFELNKFLAKRMNAHSTYDVAIKEIHHTEKKDQPSGTGITLANDVLGMLERKSKWVNEANKEESILPIISKRIDKVPGTHEVVYHSPIDSIEIKHTAHSRDGFAAGALLAADWIKDRKGIYGMSDVLFS